VKQVHVLTALQCGGGGHNTCELNVVLWNSHFMRLKRKASKASFPASMKSLIIVYCRWWAF